MRRREFLATVIGLVSSWPAFGQPPSRIAKVEHDTSARSAHRALK